MKFDVLLFKTGYSLSTDLVYNHSPDSNQSSLEIAF